MPLVAAATPGKPRSRASCTESEARRSLKEPDGLAAAAESIKQGIALIEQGDYWSYDQHCVVAKSDDRDVAQLFRFLRGPLTGRLLDIGWSDSTELYGQPSPTWAAGGFMAFEKV